MIRLISALLLAAACVLPSFAQSAAHQADKTALGRHVLTASLVEKANAASRELASRNLLKESGEDDWKKSIDELAKDMESVPGAKAVLAKHGFTGRTFILTTWSVMAAGGFVAMEGSMGKQQAAAQLATFTPEERANIELLRRNPKLLPQQ
jgi:hypothetical protein